MPKKSFRNNPAEQFLSIQVEDTAEDQRPVAEEDSGAAEVKADPKSEDTAPVSEVQAEEPVAAEAAPAAEASDSGHPVEASTKSAHPAKRKKPRKAKPVTEYKLDPRYVEKRTRRLQLILQPSLYERVRKRAVEEGISVNDLVHSILDRELTKE